MHTRNIRPNRSSDSKPLYIVGAHTLILVIVSLHFHCGKEKTRPITLAVLTCGTSEKV